MEGLWFTERQTPHIALSCLTKKVLYQTRTPYQDLMVLDTEAFGHMLTLDGVIQTSIGDEFVYHELMAHIPLNTHPHPTRVLVIGGGDGGTIREIVKHPTVTKATLVEIDAEVINAAKQFLPEISCELDNPKVEIIIGDGIAHVQQCRQEYDVIIVDSTDPVGPAVGLFSADFYGFVHQALKDEGIFVAQTESPFFDRQLIARIHRDVGNLFPITKVFLGNVPTYPGGLWSFTIGSKKYDPESIAPDRFHSTITTRYYSPEIHRAAFILPFFLKQELK
jgi:spermidine synthase